MATGKIKLILDSSVKQTLTNEVNAILNGMSPKVKVSIDPQSLSKIKSDVESIFKNGAGDKLKFNFDTSNATTQAKTMINQVSSFASSKKIPLKFEVDKTQLTNLSGTLQQMGVGKTGASSIASDFERLNLTVQKVSGTLKTYNQSLQNGKVVDVSPYERLGQVMVEATDAQGQLVKQTYAYNVETDKMVSKGAQIVSNYQAQAKAQNDIMKNEAKRATLLNNIQIYLDKNKKVQSDSGLSKSFVELQSNIKNADSMKLTGLSSEFTKLKSDVKAAGLETGVLATHFKTFITAALGIQSVYAGIQKIVQTTKDAAITIVDLNTAMIDVKKTTDETEAAYQAYYKTANTKAKDLGITTKDVIAQTAEWSRLGYTMEEAATLAENSAIFQKISPEMDISQATDGLVSTIKAFGIDVDDSMDGIISKVNSVGNSFAVSNNDLVEMLTRSSSAMSAANNSLEQTIALGTAGMEITRDAAGMGQGLKTVSMRIRANKSVPLYTEMCA